MKLFKSSISAYETAFQRDEYVLAKDVVTPDFLAFATAQLHKCRTSGHNELPGREIKSKKKQYLFDLPDGSDVLNELISAISELADIPAKNMKVSERHVMIYDDRADPVPPLHKDRLASRFSVGIPLEASQRARIALFPNGSRSKNLLDKAVYCSLSSDTGRSAYRDHSHIDAKPTLSATELIELEAQPGDAVIFAGSSIFHGRLNASASSILYFKLSDLKLDPLCEDPATPRQRAQSLDLLARVQANDSLLAESWLELSPRLQNISRVYTRANWATVLRVSVSGESDFTISDQELELLVRINGPARVRDIIDDPQFSDSYSCLLNVRRLIELGALDLLA